MGRFVIGLIVGALGAAAVYSISLGGFAFLPPLIGLVSGLLIGGLLGWRNPNPGNALVSGLLTGCLAGLLTGAGQLIGLSNAAHLSQASLWMSGVSSYDPTYGWVISGSLIILTAGVAGPFAGILSAWTGLGLRSHVAQIAQGAWGTQSAQEAQSAQRSAEQMLSTKPASLLPGPFD